MEVKKYHSKNDFFSVLLRIPKGESLFEKADPFPQVPKKIICSCGLRGHDCKQGSPSPDVHMNVSDFFAGKKNVQSYSSVSLMGKSVCD